MKVGREYSCTLKGARFLDGSAVAAPEGDDDRVISFSFSSESPCWRKYELEDGTTLEGWEVLDHDPSSVDLSFLDSGRAPLLFEHNREDQRGVVLGARVEDGFGRGSARLSRNAGGERELVDIRDGVRGNVSCFYEFTRIRVERNDDGTNTLRILRWFPVEVSLVSVPADFTVGVGRARPDRESDMPDVVVDQPTPNEPAQSGSAEPIIEAGELASARSAAWDAERTRQQEIITLGTRHNMRELTEKAIHEGTPLSEFRGQVLDAMEQRGGDQKPLYTPEGDLGLSKKEERSYSISRLIRAQTAPASERKRAHDAAKYEFEVHDAIVERSNGRNFKGYALPDFAVTGRAMAQRTVATGAPANGANLIATDHLASQFINNLQPATILGQAGARVLDGLVGNVDIPRRTGSSSYAIVGTEDAEAAESDNAFDSVQLSFHDLGVYTSVTRQMLKQSSPAVDDLILDDLTVRRVVAIDDYGLNGTGVGGNPTGVRNQSGVNAPSLAPLSFSSTIDVIRQVLAANALGLGQKTWILNSIGWRRFRTTPMDAGSGQFLLTPDTGLSEPFMGRIEGYPAAVTELMPSNLGGGTDSAAIFGPFSEMVIGLWGALDLVIDESTESRRGRVRMSAFQGVDYALRLPQAFSVVSDIAVS